MVLEALPGPERDGLQEGHQSGGLITSPPALMGQLAQGQVHAGQVMTGFTAGSQQPRNHQRPKPRPVLQRLDGDPSITGERGREERRQRAGVLDHAKPLLKAGALVPVQIVDECERVLRARRHGAGEHAAGALQHGIEAELALSTGLERSAVWGL